MINFFGGSKLHYKHEPKFFYDQQVKVIKGFYTGQIFKIQKFDENTGFYSAWIDNHYRSFSADELELIND